jgi:hypothetical protein
VDAAKYFKVQEPALEKWNFTLVILFRFLFCIQVFLTWVDRYYEDLFAEDADQATNVNVAAKAYRAVSVYPLSELTALLTMVPLFWSYSFR